MQRQKQDKNAQPSGVATDSSAEEYYLTCPNCRKSLPKDSSFCQYCGTSLQAGKSDIKPSKDNAKNFNALFTDSPPSQPTGTLQQKTKSKKPLITGIILCTIAVVVIIAIAIGIPEYKYQYVMNNMNNNDSRTYEYLSELKKSNYKNSADIYDDLYEWKVTMIAINSSEYDETTDKNSISKYDTVYFHFRLSGGKPNESIRIKVTDIPPNGVADDYFFDEVWEDGDILWYSWGYNDPEYGSAGTLQCRFYDEDDNLIGVGSVYLTD